jgi:hypothetical protein
MRTSHSAPSCCYASFVEGTGPACGDRETPRRRGLRSGLSAREYTLLTIWPETFSSRERRLCCLGDCRAHPLTGGRNSQVGFDASLD